ncbi:hypothetical protein E4T56_gene10211 [Termitomyces sp. T112]|nr:hypothetical protein E4T56_gene10211 [Termitomyces sp. T112]
MSLGLTPDLQRPPETHGTFCITSLITSLGLGVAPVLYTAILMPLPLTDALHQAAEILRLVLFGFPSASCMTLSVMTHSLDPHTLPNKPLSPQNLPQHSIKLPQHSTPTPANSNTFLANFDGPLANSDVFPAAASTSPGSPEPLGLLPCHA